MADINIAIPEGVKFVRDKTLTGMADTIRSLTGTTGNLTTDQMQSELTTTKTNIDETKALIGEMTGATGEMSVAEMKAKMEEANAQIEALYTELEDLSSQLDGKAAGGSSLEMSHVALSVDTYNSTVGYTTVDENGSLKGEGMSVLDSYIEFEAVKGSAVAVRLNVTVSLIVEATGCELVQSSNGFAVLSITDDEAAIAIEIDNSSSGGSTD